MIMDDKAGGTLPEDDDALFDNLADPTFDPDAQPAPEPEAKASAETKAEGTAATPDPEAEKPAETPAQAKEQQESHRIPLRELLDERDKRQRLERELEELKRAFPKPEAQKPPEFWEQPESSIDYRLQQAIQPLQQQLIAQQEQFSRVRAEDKYGREVVAEAFKELQDRFNSGDPTAPLDRQRVMSDPHPYGALVELHKERQTLREIGNDPAAYRTKLQDQLLSDPAFLAKAVERAQAAARGQPSAISTPSLTRTLPSVNRVGAAGSVGNTGEDLDDDNLFDKYAAGPARR